LEDIYDRQADGSFRLTQRFVNELGETQTNIRVEVIPENENISLGQASNTISETFSNPFTSPRGRQVDLSA